MGAKVYPDFTQMLYIYSTVCFGHVGHTMQFSKLQNNQMNKNNTFFFFPGAMMTFLHCKMQLEPLEDAQLGGCFQRHLI